MTYYRDASALVNIYHRESGSERMWEIYSGSDTVQISKLARPEFVSMAMRKLRDKQIDHAAHGALLAKLAEDVRSRYELLYFSSLVIEEAGRLLVSAGLQTALRTLDGVQLAFYNVHWEQETVFVCADERLVAAAGL